MGKRSFEEASIVATGVQTYEGRFGKRRRGNDYEDWPPIAQWRCNLTGLSQVHNLFFVGYSSQIYVYVPQFSTQALPRKPALIVPSQPSKAGLQGYLDSTNPHSINNLVVQFLGNEEVVAAVRDDGDVDAFLVRHILQAVERRTENDSQIGAIADEVKPIFQNNVGKSAWGLAIHSQARILAVSANTHSITVFKFGLVAETEDATPDDADAPDASSREMDVTASVFNGTSNIPYISFCNTGDDPKGKWLLTTDISGFCRSIDLDSMQPAQTFRFGVASNHFTSHDRFNSGWGILFLDRKSFIPEKSFHAAVGLELDETLPGVKNGSKLWDIGATVSHVPDCAEKFTVNKKRKSRASSRPQSSISSPLSTSSPGLRPASASSDLEETITRDESLDALSEEGGVELDLSDGAEHLEAYYDLEDDDNLEYLADADMDDEGTEDSPSFSAMYGGRRIYGNEPRAFDPEAGLCGDLPCPILHASVRNVYLLQPSDHRGPEDPLASPTVGFTNALHQLVQQEFAWLNVYERLNMNAYIPSIGIVVLASQKGRAMVLSLTKLSKSARYPSQLQDVKSEKKTKYAMRVERIVPFASQEEQMERPFAPLLGIATGPIQGTEHLPDEQKRWRLMLTYADHSILSYEISRRSSRDSAVDLQAVVV
ncbi:putative WD repeat-containing protein C27B12.05 [Pseudocercospora fuligena]|uniref:Putative WD repeat-containing protein C27B12.05 n=1 Tax=Pseudocercospora fuligena TaxID=685502 RepID=A0A8H6VIS1_9PEZI|nr:putative WD repeat-containing protein C27B12.05 [Pseudocercospora fuligena]